MAASGPASQRGAVFYLEHPQVLHDPGHFFVCIRDDPAEADVLLAYGTSQTTHIDAGSPAVQVVGDRTVNGLSNGRNTYFHPGILQRVRRDWLPDPEGNVAPRLREFGLVLKECLGLAGTQPAQAGSLRGKLVPLMGYPAAGHGLVLTCHRYSAARKLQLVVPIMFLEGSVDEPGSTVPLGLMGALAERAGYPGQRPHAVIRSITSIGHSGPLRVGEPEANYIDDWLVDRVAQQVFDYIDLPM